MLHQRLTRNLFTGQDEPLTAPLTRDFTEDLGDGRAETFFNKFGGAAAAYSLRALGSYNENVVRVRRESDNTEKDFTAIDVAGGAMARWVNEQPTLPLDLRELDTNTGERDGALIEAAAAYSLRKLKEDFTGDVVEVRRNVDGETEGFTADEVTDGTLESFVKGEEVIYESDFSAGTNGWYATNATATTEVDPIDAGNVLKITVDTSSKPKWIALEQSVVGNRYTIQAEVYVPSGNLDVDGVSLMDGAGGMRTQYTNIQTDEWVPVTTSGVASLSTLNIRPMSGTTNTDITGFLGNGTDTLYVRNVKVISYAENELPLDQATGAAAAYSLRNLSSSYTGNVVEVRRSSDDAVKSFTASAVANGTLEDWVTAEQVGWNLQPTMQIASGGGSITSQSSTGTSSTFTVSNTGGDSFLRVLGKPNSILADAGDSVVVNISVSGLASDTLFRLYTSASNTSRALQAIGNGDNQELTLTPNGQVGYFGFTAFNTTTEATVTINSITVIGKSAAVRTWYDQSGSDNHAVQTTPANQPKIVEGGSLNRDSDNNVAVKFDSSSDQYLENASLPSSFTSSNVTFSDFTVQEALQNNVTTTAWGFGSTVSSATRLTKLFHSGGNFGYQGYGSTASYVSAFDAASYSANEVLLSSGVRVGTDLDIFKNSADADMDNSFDTGTINLNTFAIGSYVRSSGSTNPFNGNIAEVIIYDSDQSTKRRAIEENIANHYDISLAAFSRDGTVSTWYDQSGSTNDATQTDPTKQPKIVEGGSLLKDNGIAGVDFDQTNETTLVATGVSGLVGSLSLFSQSIRDLSGYTVSLSNSTTGGRFFALQEGGSTTVANPRNPTNGVTVSASVTGNTRLGFAVTTSDTYTDVGALGGTLVNTTTDYGDTFGSGDIDQVLIGALRTVTETGHFDGRIREIIVYNSDQTDNRTAIEANIGETYGITDIPAANDTVNGYVQTWYDQSGGPAADPENITGFTITGSGADATYTIDSTSQGDKISFTGGSYNIRFTSGQWRIYEGGDLHHYSAEDVNYPWDVTSWTTTSDGSGTPVFGSFVGGSPTPYPANDAVQTTAANQPKIVDAGSLVKTTSNLPAIDFTSSFTGLTASRFITGQSNAFFSVYEAEAGDSTQSQVIFRQGSSYRIACEVIPNGRVSSSLRDGGGDSVSASSGGDLATGVPLLQSVFIGARGVNGLTNFVNGANEVNVNTSAIEDVDFSSVDTGSFGIGAIPNNSAYDMHGSIQELIIYNSDQSSNRPAIETNIANQYGITLS